MIVAATYIILMLIVVGVASAMIFSGPKDQPKDDENDNGKPTA